MPIRSPALAARATAARVVDEVLQAGRSLNAALEPALATLPPAKQSEAALIQEMVYGTLRWAIQLDGQLRAFLDKPLKQKDQDVHALLLVGLYQLNYMHVAPHAAVTETVSAANDLGKPWARNLINAVLRNYLRMPPEKRAALISEPALAHSHPAWLLDRLQQAWPQDWQAICRANNERPPMTLRVNLRQGTRADYLQTLRAAGMEAEACARNDSGITLGHPVAVSALPGFAAGRVSVQDNAAQLAASLLDAHSGDHVLDACAAPGGKACHVLEHTDNIELVAVDNDAERLPRLQQNLDRLGLSARVITGDAAVSQPWWDGTRFNRILLDAPCSATGVIRRHPDIKHHRSTADLVQLQRTQRALLDGLWPLLAPGGKLLYVTCSILPEENSAQIRTFLDTHPDAATLTLPLAWTHDLGTGYQILPGESGMDGFFFAGLQKTGA